MSCRKLLNSNQTGCTNPDSKDPTTLREIVDYYNRTHHKSFQCEVTSWKECAESKRQILIRAASCIRFDGKMQSHQRCIAKVALKEAGKAITKVQVSKLCNFQELISAVDDAIGSIKGTGELTVYDVACRVGANLGLRPERVYLHSGTRKGAEKLLEHLKRTGQTPNFNVKDEVIDVERFPPEFHKLLADEIENCLCTSKDCFEKLR